MPQPEDFDVVLAGGGLANGLIAWRLSTQRPGLRICLIEEGATLGGNHTWSLHDSDIEPQQQRWLDPFIEHRWPQHAVMFRGRERQLPGGYASITSGRFHRVLMRRLAGSSEAVVRLDTRLAQVKPTHVVTATGERITAGAVIDGRGFRPSRHLNVRHQKFVGIELLLARPHHLAGPIIMDARVPQLDGYRFVYVLPLDARRLLIEDTYYADGDALDPAMLRQRVQDYAEAAGWPVLRALREEHGILPIALSGDISAFWRDQQGQPCSGLRAALFHPTTGYSLPQAVRLADMITDLEDLSAPALFQAIAQHGRTTWRSQSFFRMLNRMLFLAARPERRHQVLAHFYRLPDRLVDRFYGERLSLADKLRIVSGKPPIPIPSALRAILGGAFG